MKENTGRRKNASTIKLISKVVLCSLTSSAGSQKLYCGIYNLFQERSRDEREVRLSKQEGAKLGVVRVIIKRAVSMLVVGVCVDHLVREQDDRLREVTDPNFEKARSSSLTWSS